MDKHVQAVPLTKSFLLLNHGPVVMIGSASSERKNVMSASWVMPLDFNPPRVAVVISSTNLTREFIETSGEFSLNIPCRNIAKQVLAAGGVSGRKGDKIEPCGIELFEASRIRAPLVRGCVGWLECKVIPEPENQSRYDLFIAEVVAAWSDPEVFSDGRWHFPDDGRRTLHYQAGGSFFMTGESHSTDGASA